ncbi:MAG: membrane protein insertase YidC [Vicinamibacterales bacterium]|jgi:YidC/Oxa1 family membrane protein insertase|nr:membrane protein insertase YidC [Vicinamibacterales bacterium]
MERRVLLAVFLSFLVLVIYQRWVGPQPVPGEPIGVDPAVSPAAPTGVTEPAPAVDTQAAAPAPTVLPGAGEVASPAGNAEETASFEPVVSDSAPRDIVVESEFVRAVFANRGAELVSWQLKQFEDDIGGSVELVPPEVEPGQAWPFSLVVPEDPELTNRLDNALFRPSAERLQLTADQATLVFEFEDSSGLRARKEFTFHASLDQPYVVGFTASVTTPAGAQPLTIRWGPALGGVRTGGSRMAMRQFPGAVLFGRVFQDGLLQEDDIYRAQPANLQEQPTYEGQLEFVGVDNHYFLAAVLPGMRESRVDYSPVSAVGLDHDLVAFDLTIEPGGDELPVFIGPKDFDLLRAAHPDLVRAINFGFLSLIVVPLHQTLKWIYGFVGNYGWSIILLTVLINILIFPLRHKSVVSMRKMQELQPEMKAIQARYANLKTTDPAKQKMNQEVMELYRKHGANPASGCLPMLATMPILFAFFRLLSAAVELRGAPFILWITDLSVSDPLYVTPIIMGASMVFQQRLQPSGADPTQQKIMMLMPVVFTFMFLAAPSGLVIYWLTSNVIGIGQQLVTNRIAGPPRPHSVRPPAERQVKKIAEVGTGGSEPAGDGVAAKTPPAKKPRHGKGSRRGRSKGSQ